MLSFREIRENTSALIENLSKRSTSYPEQIKEILLLNKKKSALQQRLDSLKTERNKLSKSVCSATEAEQIKEQVKTINLEIRNSQEDFDLLENQIKSLVLVLPNLLDSSVPTGTDQSENKIIKTQGSIKIFEKVKPHEQIGKELGIIDFDFTSKISGSRFSTFIGLGAKLERALIQFMLDQAVENDYLELLTPCIVKEEILQGTGQLPKFADDLYKLEKTGQYLIPTAEVTLTAFFAQEKFIDLGSLPKKLCSYTPCFRSEAGSAGKDTTGIIRQHQFDKVELVHLCKAEESEREHEKLSQHIEDLLKKLELPYRKLLLCSGDTGFSASKCYDFEVWMPAQNKYREISSCSNCTDFQARRLKLKYKNPKKNKLELVHTLNGSGLAVGRTWAAIVENYQITKKNKTSIQVPKVLRKYLNLDLI